MKISNIAVNGIEQTELVKDQYSNENLTLERSIQITPMARDESQKINVKLLPEQVIELVYEDGTTWITGPDTLDDIYPEMLASSMRSADNVVEIPVELGLAGAERGIANKVLLKVVNIFTKKFVKHEVRKLAETLENRQLENNVGLFSLTADLHFTDLKIVDPQLPYLLFIHGTASSFRGSFDKMKGTELLRNINETYPDRALAFQHRTLTENPLQNMLDLVKALPKNITLHLMTSSRGGLVGELLSRFCNSHTANQGFTPAEINILENDYPADYYKTLVSLIEEIRKNLSSKNIKIEKFIRVACPADGTTLASKRMDIFLNFLMNLIGAGTGIGATPVYIAFKNLVAAVVDSKNDIEVLPGLEVQSPKSPLIKVLNAVPDLTNPDQTVVINNSLVVIGGNVKPALKLSALLVIASKLFFFTKNDLVVNSESMSLGTRRSGLVQQFFYEGSDINHFQYFENRTTNGAILQALKSNWGEKLPGFTEERLSITVEAERNALLGLDGGKVFKDDVSGTKPIVVLLPGIMGSNLSLNDSTIWINYWKFISGGLIHLNDSKIKATSLVSTSYKKITAYLSDEYDVVTFPFDWRQPIDETAKKLNDKMEDLLEYGQPIKVIGHSMGGVLFRDFIVNHRAETWEKLNRSKGFRLIFLGSPLNGSFRIPFVLFGKDGLTHKLDKIDKFHKEEDLIKVFSGFKGLLGLLPFNTDKDNDFSKPETWKKMLEGFDNPKWPVPADTDLEWFGKYRDNILGNTRPEDFDNAVYIAGHDDATPCGFRIDEKSSGKELVFLSTSEGDQSVTWETGIPKKMADNNLVYYVDVSHGSLACEPDLFKGIKELLDKGATNLFSKIRPTVRGEEKLFRSPEFRDFDLSLMGIEDTILGRKTKTKTVSNEPPLLVSVSQGDLFYARFPVLAGHFEHDGILYAEKAIDRSLNGILNQQLQLGNYPGEIGSNELFVTDQKGFKGAVVIGLGDPGTLTASELTKTVEQGVSNYLLRIINSTLIANSLIGETEKIGISSIIIGCGYGGLSIENSIKAIIQGVHNANTKIRNLKLENTRVIEQIEFVEKFKDKAVTSLFSISRIEKEEANTFKIAMDGRGIKVLLGSSERIPHETSEGWWNRINVYRRRDIKDKSVQSLIFNASTKSSRAEEQELFSTPALMESIIKDMSTNNRWTPEDAKTIFELLIPNGFKEQLKRHGNINWVVDKYTATYPWELLQESVRDAKPLCVSAGMIRQLSTENYRTAVKTVSKNTALVVADPDLKGFINQLPGALKEGQLVSELLQSHSIGTTKSLNETHTDIIRKLFCDDYKIIHLSGHGVYNKDISKGSGMVIGDNMFLSTREIKQMSTVPELVFVNCCHLGKADGVADELFQERYKLAANIGTQLIENGVRCVIAAGWAVNDDAALEFARIFYQRMFDGSNFGDAVKDARNVVFEKFGHNNTWGAYQCYGDPFYKFDHLKSSKSRKKKNYLIAQEAEVDLVNLLYDVEIGKLETKDYLEKLNEISEAIDKSKIRNSIITEKEALIYFELKEYDYACDKFSELLKLEDASFSFSVAEKYCNARAKKVIQDFVKAGQSLNNSKYLKEISKVIGDLETLNKLSPTAQRFNILASTYKRKAVLYSLKVEKEKEQKKKAYMEAAKYYQRAYANFKTWYSLTNWLTLESALILSGVHKWGTKNKSVPYEIPTKEKALEMLSELQKEIAEKTDRMSYWDMLAGINIELCVYTVKFSAAKGSTDLDDIMQEISSLWRIAGSKGKRFAEIEHLEFLIDVLSIEINKNTAQLKNKLVKLVSELKSMM